MIRAPMDWTRSLLLGRALLAAVSPTLARALGPPVMALGMAFVWMLQAMPEDMVRRAAAAQGPVAAAATLALIALAQAVALRPPLMIALRSPGVDLLDRQPLPGRVWSLALIPIAAGLASPAGLIALLWPWRAPALAALMVTAQAALLVFCLARPGLGRWGWGAAASALGGLAFAAARAWPAAEGLISVGAAGLCVALLGPARLQGARRLPDGEAAVAPRPRGPRSALIGRDALALWRLDRGLVLGAALGLALPWPLLRGLWRNGGMEAPGLEVAALLFMALLSPLLAVAMSQLGERLGARLDVPEWPVSAADRALTLTALPLAWSALAVGALVSAAPGMLLPWGGVRLAAMGVGLSGLAALQMVYRWPPKLNMGVWCGLATALCALCALAGRAGAPLAVAAGGLALWAAARRLDLQRSART